LIPRKRLSILFLVLLLKNEIREKSCQITKFRSLNFLQIGIFTNIQSQKPKPTKYKVIKRNPKLSAIDLLHQGSQNKIESGPVQKLKNCGRPQVFFNSIMFRISFKMNAILRSLNTTVRSESRCAFRLRYVGGGAYKSLARPTSRCRRRESIVSLERGVCSCAELQVFSCQETRAIATTSRRELSSHSFS
jgi:hypothetical protein